MKQLFPVIVPTVRRHMKIVWYSIHLDAEKDKFEDRFLREVDREKTAERLHLSLFPPEFEPGGIEVEFYVRG